MALIFLNMRMELWWANTKTPWKHKVCYAIDMWLTYYSFFMEAVVDCYTSTVKQLPKYYNVNRNGSTDQQSQGSISTYKFSKLIFIHFLTELVMRICSKIEAFLLGDHYIYSHKLFLLTMYWYNLLGESWCCSWSVTLGNKGLTNYFLKQENTRHTSSKLCFVALGSDS